MDSYLTRLARSALPPVSGADAPRPRLWEGADGADGTPLELDVETPVIRAPGRSVESRQIVTAPATMPAPDTADVATPKQRWSTKPDPMGQSDSSAVAPLQSLTSAASLIVPPPLESLASSAAPGGRPGEGGGREIQTDNRDATSSTYAAPVISTPGAELFPHVAIPKSSSEVPAGVASVAASSLTLDDASPMIGPPLGVSPSLWTFSVSRPVPQGSASGQLPVAPGVSSEDHQPVAPGRPASQPDAAERGAARTLTPPQPVRPISPPRSPTGPLPLPDRAPPVEPAESSLTIGRIDLTVVQPPAESRRSRDAGPRPPAARTAAARADEFLASRGLAWFRFKA